MKKKLIFLLPILVFLIFIGYLIFLLCFFITSYFGTNIKKEKIIKDFNNNINLYEKSYEEIKNINQNIIFEKINNNIEIKECIKNNCKYIDDNNYTYTIKLMKKNKINKIKIYEENIYYTIKSSLKMSQYIIYIRNINKLDNKYVKNKIKIKNNWYYIELI